MSAYVESTRAEIVRRLAEGDSAVEILNEICRAFETNVPGIHMAGSIVSGAYSPRVETQG